MSALIKKKGALTFKPKLAPRKVPSSVSTSQPSTTPRQSVDRQSQTPAAALRPTPALSPPPSAALITNQTTHDARVSTIEPPRVTIEEPAQAVRPVPQPFPQDTRCSASHLIPKDSLDSQRSPEQSRRPENEASQIESTTVRRLPILTDRGSDVGSSVAAGLQKTTAVSSSVDQALLPLSYKAVQSTSVSLTGMSNNIDIRTPVSSTEAEATNVSVPASALSLVLLSTESQGSTSGLSTAPKRGLRRPQPVTKKVAKLRGRARALATTDEALARFEAAPPQSAEPAIGPPPQASVLASQENIVSDIDTQDATSARTTKSHAARRKRAAGPANDDVVESIEIRPRKKARISAVTGTKQTRKRISKVSDTMAAAALMNLAEAIGVTAGTESEIANAEDATPPKRPRKRAQTPDDAEEQEIDPSTVKMADLCKDMRIGRKFSKHDEIKQREVEKKLHAKLRRDNPELVDIEEGRAETEEVEQASLAMAQVGVQMRVVNGQIVLDDRTLVVDRHAQAAIDADIMEVVEENEFSKMTNSATHMNRNRNLKWTYEATELFYDGLRMFGTDFEMIAGLFPSRNRRHIKSKFTTEEKNRPYMIDRAMRGEKVAIDLDEYKQATGRTLAEIAEVEKELAQGDKEQEAERSRILAAAAEANAQKRSAIESATGGESSKENGGITETGRASAASKSKKKAKSKKSKHALDGGGDEVEVLGDA